MEPYYPGEFVERMLTSTEKLEDMGDRIDRLTLEHLEVFAIRSAATKFLHDGSVDDEWVRHGTATKILNFFLGKAWVLENSFSFEEAASRKSKATRDFFQSPLEGADVSYRHLQRVTSLAECLYNLQAIPGFKHRLSIIKSDDLESMLGEFECAKLISASPLLFRFVIPESQEKGCDYDGEFATPTGRVICCEFETKRKKRPTAPHRRLTRLSQPESSSQRAVPESCF